MEFTAIRCAVSYWWLLNGVEQGDGQISQQRIKATGQLNGTWMLRGLIIQSTRHRGQARGEGWQGQCLNEVKSSLPPAKMGCWADGSTLYGTSCTVHYFVVGHPQYGKGNTMRLGWCLQQELLDTRQTPFYSPRPFRTMLFVHRMDCFYWTLNSVIDTLCWFGGRKLNCSFQFMF